MPINWYAGLVSLVLLTSTSIAMDSVSYKAYPYNKRELSDIDFEDGQENKNSCVGFLVLPKDLLIKIIACCERNELRRVCRKLLRLASKQNYKLLFYSPLSMSEADRQQFLLWICGQSAYPNNQQIDSAAAVIAIVANLLNCGPELKQNFCEKLLLTAVKNDHGNVVYALLKSSNVLASCLLATKDPDIAPLHTAARIGAINSMRTLLQARAIVDAPCDNGKTPLYLATREGKLEAVKLLLEWKASIDSKNCGFTPLFVAANSGHSEIIAYLLLHRADPNSLEGDVKCSPIYIASQNGHQNAVKLLMDAKADHDLGRYAPLYIAAEHGYLEVIQVLLSRPMKSLNTLSPDRPTALYVASQNGHALVVQSLIQAGADVEIPYKGVYRPLYVASHKGYLKVVEVLLQAGANIHAKTLREASALYVASQNGHLEIVKKLVEMGANIEDHFENGHTPLHIAVAANKKDVVEFLLQAGADPLARNNQQQTPRDLAQGDIKMEALFAIFK